MSRENVELVRRAFEAYNARDAAGLAELCEPEFEWLPHMATLSDGRSYRGRRGIERHFAETDETWEGLHLKVDETYDGGATIVVAGWIDAHGRGSGVEVHLPLAWTFEVREGKLARCINYDQDRDALAAAGLREVGSA